MSMVSRIETPNSASATPRALDTWMKRRRSLLLAKSGFSRSLHSSSCASNTCSSARVVRGSRICSSMPVHWMNPADTAVAMPTKKVGRATL